MLKLWDIINWEKINLIVKKHYIINVFLWIFIFFTLIIFVALFYIYSWKVLVYFWLVIFLELILSILYFFILEKELDILIITNSKVILINKFSFLNRQFIEFNLNEIKEIKAKYKGYLWNTFNFWTLEIFVKNHNKSFSLKYITDVIEVAKEINNLSKNK